MKQHVSASESAFHSHWKWVTGSSNCVELKFRGFWVIHITQHRDQIEIEIEIEIEMRTPITHHQQNPTIFKMPSV
ncbi:hypothetical protein Ahy_B08g094201 isoform C [Arachis hypogaea]|uniref:Uncharacterized protein n=1 Tax=Arachis hypogaea TaxID=3818 RepID=A0A444Y874_ARAHY|nr:hypothetical protein Ahy_B08g094201 isoform C [Arachis hypogaea]